jgi:alanine racemase
VTLIARVDGPKLVAHARRVLNDYGDVIAVVKGNGYGLGMRRLAKLALALGVPDLAVGTVHELELLPPEVMEPTVLTPILGDAVPVGAILTVSSIRHVDAIPASAPVVIKLASTMRRYGATPGQLPRLMSTIEKAGVDLRGYAIHLPLDGNTFEVDTWLGKLDTTLPVSVSHLTPQALAELRERHPAQRLPIRLGTALWHGDKSFLALRATVLDTQPVGPNDRVGYRAVASPGAGTIVMIGAGTAHGVHPLADGRSPFHFARRRLSLVEPPHMHTSMVWIARGETVPDPGTEVDVQQPLTWVRPDVILGMDGS